MNGQTAQSGNPTNRSMPPGVIIPELGYPELEAAVSWLCQTFGFRERLRIGSHRAQLVFGGASIVVVAQPGGEIRHSRGELAHSIMVRVENVDRHCAQVQQSGARIVNPPADYPYGERQYTVEDLAGRRWTFSQTIADVDPGEWGGALIEK
jgi:uncharacterized glyoxalase superfamily protein PhnB